MTRSTPPQVLIIVSNPLATEAASVTSIATPRTRSAKGLLEVRDQIFQGRPGQIRHRHMAAILEQPLRNCRSDCARRPRDHGDFPSQRQFIALPELGMLEGVVLHFKQMAFRETLIGSHRRDLGLNRKRVRCDVACDLRFVNIPARTERTQARQQQHAG